MAIETTSGVFANIIMVDTGGNHTCVLTNRGKVRCFGANTNGQLGYDHTDTLGDGGTEIEDLADVSLPSDPSIAMISLGDGNTCAVTTLNKGRCWGNNDGGRLGQDSGAANFGGGVGLMSSVDDIAIGDIISITAFNGTTCAVTSSNAARCWGAGYGGRNGYGNELNIGNDTNSISTATDIDVVGAGTVDSADQVVAEIVSGIATCINSTTGQVKCWGQYSNGSLGDGTTNDWGDTSGEEPADKSWLDFGSKVVQIVSKPSIAAQASTCVLTETGEIYCWGAGVNGGLGYASTADIGDGELATDLAPVAVWGPAQASPDTVQPSNLKFWVDASDTSTIYASSDCSTTLASDDGEVQCWKDKSGNSYNVSSTTAGNYPLLRLNENHGLPALEFDGTDDHLTGTLTGLSGDQSHTIFVVYDANNKGSNQRPSFGGSTSSTHTR